MQTSEKIKAMVFDVDREEAEENYRRAMAATESLKQFVENSRSAIVPRG
jgi:hypothetical protein